MAGKSTFALKEYALVNIGCASLGDPNTRVDHIRLDCSGTAVSVESQFKNAPFLSWQQPDGTDRLPARFVLVLLPP